METDALRFAEGNLSGIDPRPQEAGRGHRFRVVGGDLVACDLPAHKLIVRQIRIQGPDDKVAIVKGELPVVVVFEAVTLREAREVEPVPPPTFPVAGTREEVIDEMFVSLRVGILEELRDLLGGGREANEIEEGPADELALAEGMRGLEPFLAQFVEDEAVDLAVGIIAGGRGWILAKGRVGPVGAILSAHLHGPFRVARFLKEGTVIGRSKLDPLLDRSDRIGGKLWFFGRHREVLVEVRDGLIEKALVQITGDHREAFVASLEQALAGDEVESRLGLLASMATEAVFFEKTANLGGEDLLTFRHVCRVCSRDGRRGKGQGQ